VFAAESDNLQALKDNCQSKHFQASDWLPGPDHVIGKWPIKPQGDREITVCPFSTQTVLHLEAFSFM